MRIYVVESDYGMRDGYARIEDARVYLTRNGYKQRQPNLDIDPEVECWWSGNLLLRLIPVEVHT